MACLSMKLSLALPAVLSVATATGAELAVDVVEQTAIEVTAKPVTAVRVVTGSSNLRVTPTRQAALTIRDLQIIGDNEKPKPPVWNTAILSVEMATPSHVTLEKTSGTELSVTSRQSSVYVEPAQPASFGLACESFVAMAITPIAVSTLSIGEVCSISGGEITVLAASDGPLRIRNGGYIPIDPAREAE